MERRDIRPLENEMNEPVYLDIGVTWLITLVRGNRLWVLGVKSWSQVRNRGKIGLNQSVTF
jgi:hypothetical protein